MPRPYADNPLHSCPSSCQWKRCSERASGREKSASDYWLLHASPPSLARHHFESGALLWRSLLFDWCCLDLKTSWFTSDWAWRGVSPGGRWRGCEGAGCIKGKAPDPRDALPPSILHPPDRSYQNLVRPVSTGNTPTAFTVVVGTRLESKSRQTHAGIRFWDLIAQVIVYISLLHVQYNTIQYNAIQLY